MLKIRPLFAPHVNLAKLVRVYESLNNPKDKERVVTEALFFLAQVKGKNFKIPSSHSTAFLGIVDRIRALGTPVRITRDEFLANCDTQSSVSLSDLQSLISSSPRHELQKLFETVSLKVKSGQIAKTEIIPIVEQRVYQEWKNERPSLGEVCSIISLVSALKISNVNIFKLIVDALLEVPESELVAGLHPAIALKLVQDLGWSGLTHPKLVTETLVPVFENFRNYQALTSTLIIAGGLQGGALPSLVANCMQTIRADKERNNPRFPLTVEGHCQIIRRLVICGYYSEAIELFNHFTPKQYMDYVSQNPTGRNQIYRLFLSSFLAPEIVPRSAVEFLKTDAVRTESQSQTFYDMTGIHGSNSSFIHTLVVNNLNKLGLESVSEYIEPETMLSVDIFVPSLKLGIEVQGPSHFITDLETGETRMRPEDRFKINVLSKVGINMEIVSIHDFGRKNATRNSEQFILSLISKYR